MKYIPSAPSQTTTIVIILTMVFLLIVVLLTASYLHRHVQKQRLRDGTKYMASVPTEDGRRRWVQFNPNTSGRRSTQAGNSFKSGHWHGGGHRGQHGRAHEHGNGHGGVHGGGYTGLHGQHMPTQMSSAPRRHGEEVTRPERVYRAAHR
jgi:hypothetical protein